MILKKLCEIQDSVNLVQHYFEQFWSIDAITSHTLASRLIPHIDQLVNCKSALIEYPYVDKVYRNSYYHYFASKNNEYHRDCIRISFFSKIMSDKDFRGIDASEKLQHHYLGFMVIRPTIPQIIGRSAISPFAINGGLKLCLAPINSTVNGLKVATNAFPHSSQDGETISCAETTLWSLQEYYSSKYQEYHPVLPSDVLTALAETTGERQIPSDGLEVTQIAYAQKHFGFGPRIYSEEADPSTFHLICAIYIESGIPLTAALLSKDQIIGHAVIIAGRSEIIPEHFDSLHTSSISDLELQRELENKGFEYYDFHQVERDYAFIDDNSVAYQRNSLNKPCAHYESEQWKSCKVTHIVAPLYPKMYLEAKTAKDYFELVLFQILKVQNSLPSILTRFYMTSSRSYKHYIAENASFNYTLGEALIALEMPKFIWVGELSNKDLIKSNQAIGLVILDATEANCYNQKPLLAAAINDMLLLKRNRNDIEKFALNLQAFSVFENNLKSN